MNVFARLLCVPSSWLPEHHIEKHKKYSLFDIEAGDHGRRKRQEGRKQEIKWELALQDGCIVDTSIIETDGNCSIFRRTSTINYCRPKQSSDVAMCEKTLCMWSGGRAEKFRAGPQPVGGEVGSHDLGFSQTTALLCPARKQF